MKYVDPVRGHPDFAELAGEIPAIGREFFTRFLADARHEILRALILRKAHNALQAGLLLLTVWAMYLVNLGTAPADHFHGNLVGLISQPLWLYTTWRHRQWGAFIASCAYTAIWIAGISRHVVIVY